MEQTEVKLREMFVRGAGRKKIDYFFRPRAEVKQGDEQEVAFLTQQTVALFHKRRS